MKEFTLHPDDDALASDLHFAWSVQKRQGDETSFPLKQYEIERQGQKRAYCLRSTPGDRDCFFHAVDRPDLTRATLITKLREHSHENWLREAFAYEIKQFLFLRYHPDPQENQACQNMLKREILSLFEVLNKAEALLRKRIETARAALGEAETLGMLPDALLRLLPFQEPSLALAFENAYRQVVASNNAIQIYCQDKSVFESYLSHYLETAQGYIAFTRYGSGESVNTTIDAINRLFQLTIQVYVEDSKECTKLVLANQLCPGNIIPIHHQGIHFSGLEKVHPAPNLQEHVDNGRMPTSVSLRRAASVVSSSDTSPSNGLTINSGLIGSGGVVTSTAVLENVKAIGLQAILPENATEETIRGTQAIIQQFQQQNTQIRSYVIAASEGSLPEGRVEGRVENSSSRGVEVEIEPESLDDARKRRKVAAPSSAFPFLSPASVPPAISPVSIGKLQGNVNAPVTTVGAIIGNPTFNIFASPPPSDEKLTALNHFNSIIEPTKEQRQLLKEFIERGEETFIGQGAKEGMEWEGLVKAVKQRYATDDAHISNFAKKRPIQECYVNLALIKEEREQTREQLAGKRKSAEEKNNQAGLRETWLNSYEALDAVKIPITPEKLFAPNHETVTSEECKKVLVLGRAGSGKSVLCQYLAFQWAHEKLWQATPFTLVLWIPLRSLTDEALYPAHQAITIGKVLYERYKKHLPRLGRGVSAGAIIEALDELVEAHESNILYVLDGYDEVATLSPSQRQVSHFLEELLTKERFLLTSRPYYIDKYLTFGKSDITLDRRLENRGFVDEDIPRYIRGYSWERSTQGEALCGMVEENANVKGIAHIPINLALLCRHWQTLEPAQQATFNPTMTELYEALVADLLYEHLGTESEKGKIEFKNNTVRGILENEAVQSILYFLEQLAFLQMQDETLIIKKERINQLLGAQKSFKEILETGLLVSPDEKEKRFEERREHYFIHLTFQEFFAARYLARVCKEAHEAHHLVTRLDKKETQESLAKQPLSAFIAAHKYDLRYEIVWWFVAGLLKEHEAGLERFFDELLTAPRDIIQSYEPLLWIKCLEECQLRLKQKAPLIKVIKGRTEVLVSDNQSFLPFYSSTYSHLWWETLSSSSRVWAVLDIFPNQASLVAASEALQWKSLPAALIHRYLTLLETGDDEAIKAASRILMSCSNLPSLVIQRLVTWLAGLDSRQKWVILQVLSYKSNLVEALLAQVIALWEKDPSKAVKDPAGEVLKSHRKLPANLFARIRELLKSPSVEAKVWTLQMLWYKQALTEDLLMEVMALWEKNPCKAVKDEAEEVLVSRHELPPRVLEHVQVLLNANDGKAKARGLEILNNKSTLPETILVKVIGLWRGKNEPKIKSAAHAVLMGQVIWSPLLLSHILAQLDSSVTRVKNAALYILKDKPNLPEVVLTKLWALVEKEVKTKITNAAWGILFDQTALPLSIITLLVDGWQTKQETTRIQARKILRNQPHLPVDVIEQLLADLLFAERGWKQETKMDFITRHFKSLVTTPGLWSRVMDNVELLANVLYCHAFEGKGVVYFDNIGLTLTLGHQLISIALRDGELRVKMERRWSLLLKYGNAHAAYQCAEAKFDEKDYPGAIDDYTAAIHLQPRKLAYYACRGWIKMLSEDFLGAIKDASKSINLAQENAGVYCNRAWAHLFNSKRTSALKDVKQALALKKYSGEARCILALLCLQLRELDAAHVIAWQAFRLENKGYAVFILAQLWGLQKNDKAYQALMAKAQKLGDSHHLFDFLEQYVSKLFPKKKEKIANEIDPEEKNEILHLASPFLSGYSTSFLTSASGQRGRKRKKQRR